MTITFISHLWFVFEDNQPVAWFATKSEAVKFVQAHEWQDLRVA